jgi:flavin reductase (DIM6/NTAB) family NADH-FMN oxidoreductase RutF
MFYMNCISIETIKSWERFYRANFINSLTGFKSVSLIGSIDKSGKPNLAIFSSIVHLGADPALVGFINRPLAAAPHTIGNIEATGEYTINHIHAGILPQAHQTSAKYDIEVNEFEAVGLTPQYLHTCKAPFVAESNIKYALNLVEIVPIKHNNTFFVIGSICEVILPTTIIQKDGFIEANKAGSIASTGLDAYYSAELINRFAYAKPNETSKTLEL